MHIFLRPLMVVIIFAHINSLAAPMLNADHASIEVGYMVSPHLLDDKFYHYPVIQRIFGSYLNTYPGRVTYDTLEEIEPVVHAVVDYIEEEKKGSMINCEKSNSSCKQSFEDINGVTETTLASEITTASFCFGTDPFIVASKIRLESRFDMTAISSTGAIGLTQLTTVGLKEILDQLGHRGASYAILENDAFIKKAIECYAGQSLNKVFFDFPKIGTAKTKDREIVYSSEMIKQLKAWILPPKRLLTRDNKKTFIQRQLFMGQILLKIYLAYSKQVMPKATTLKHYETALKMFNGDVKQVKYAKNVIALSKPIRQL